MQNVTIFDHPLINHHLARLRHKDTDATEFRNRLEHICKLMIFGISEDLPTRPVRIETPLETTTCRELDCNIVVVSILRAGLAMQDAFVKLYPEATIGHLGFYRNEKTLQPVQYYAKIPKTDSQTVVVLCDPMLATGGSINASIDLLKNNGATRIICFTLVSAPEGIQAVHDKHPEVKIYSAALDRQLNEKGYILPGLGDAGDRQFGTV